LKSMVTGDRMIAPSGVYEAYGDVIAGFAQPVSTDAIGAASSLTARP
jgi:hypothetical protein